VYKATDVVDKAVKAYTWPVNEIIELPPEILAERLDMWLAHNRPHHTRKLWKQYISAGLVAVNGRKAVPAFKVQSGMIITLAEACQTAPSLAAAHNPTTPRTLDILCQQDGLVAVNKPAGMHCHPNRSDSLAISTVASILAEMFPGFASAGSNPLEGGLMNRLDCDTSGVLLACTSLAAREHWQVHLNHPSCTKTYLSILCGSIPENNCFSTDWPIAHHERKSDRVVAVKAGSEPYRGTPRPAVSDWTILSRSNNHALASIQVHKAQFHQIRAHAQALGCPLLADKVYGTPTITTPIMSRHALHAWKLSVNGLDIEAPIPADFQAAITSLNLSLPE